MTLVEATVSITALAGALLGVTASVLATARLDQTVADKQAASRALSSLVEEVRATPFDDLSGTWSATTRNVRVQNADAAATFLVTDAVVSASWPVRRVQITVDMPDSSPLDVLQTTVYVSERAAGSGGL